MPGVGVGGLFSNLFNPGLDDRLAQHVTPNPNPLAQQGGPVDPKAVDSLGNPVPAQQPNVGNLAPAAVTQPDPVNSSYAADLLKAHRQDAAVGGLQPEHRGRGGGFRHRAATSVQAGRPSRRRQRSGRFARGPQRHPRDAGPDDPGQRACPLHGIRGDLRSDLVAVAWATCVDQGSHRLFKNSPDADEVVRRPRWARTRSRPTSSRRPTPRRAIGPPPIRTPRRGDRAA